MTEGDPFSSGELFSEEEIDRFIEDDHRLSPYRVTFRPNPVCDTPAVEYSEDTTGGGVDS